MREEMGKETLKKEMDLDVFLWRHTWHFPYLRLLHKSWFNAIWLGEVNKIFQKVIVHENKAHNQTIGAIIKAVPAVELYALVWRKYHQCSVWALPLCGVHQNQPHRSTMSRYISENKYYKIANIGKIVKIDI